MVQLVPQGKCSKRQGVGCQSKIIINPSKSRGFDKLEVTVVKVNILGTEYSIIKKDYNNVPEFKKLGIDGYCDSVTKEIVVCNMATYPGYEDETPERNSLVEKHTLRHEIVHAFLNESGLQESSVQPRGGWSQNEEMVDWIAIQFHKILKAFESVGVL